MCFFFIFKELPHCGCHTFSWGATVALLGMLGGHLQSHSHNPMIMARVSMFKMHYKVQVDTKVALY